MSNYRVISSDDHVIEPLDLLTTRTESKFKDRVPHLERLEEGDWWICEELKVLSRSYDPLCAYPKILPNGQRLGGIELPYLKWASERYELPIH